MSGTESGVFWSPLRGVRLKGEIFEHNGEVTILSNLIVVPAGLKVGTNSVAYNVSGLNTAIDHLPQVIHGVLDDGEEVSLLDSQMMFEFPFTERFKGRRLVVGGNVTHETEVREVRWTFPLPLGVYGSQEFNTSLGSLSSWSCDGLNGFRLVLRGQLSLIDAVELLPNYSSSLFLLASGTSVEPAVVEFDTSDGDSCVFGLPGKSGPVRRADFIGFERIGLCEMAKWLEVREVLGRYPFVYGFDRGPVEIQGQVLTSSIEGLDRRMHATESVFSTLTRKERRELRSVIVDVSKEWLNSVEFADIEAGVLAIRNTIAHVGEPTYVDRVKRVLSPTLRLIPTLFAGDLDGWARKTRNLRNDESHGLSGTILSYPEISSYTAIVRTVRWALRLRILQEVFDDTTIREAFASSSGLEFLFANLDADQVWPHFQFSKSYQSEISGIEG